MKRWALVVAALYALMLGALTLPFGWLAFAPQMKLKDALDTFHQWQWWLWLAIMGLAQAALLAVPVRMASRRPVSRRPLILTVLAGALMMGGLFAGAIYALCEFAFAQNAGDDRHFILTNQIAIGMALVAWGCWALVFYRAGRKSAPEDFVARLCQTLLKGSILELLVAVPTHIVARCRDYCCAGLMTFIGLSMGVAVMLFSFGPGVFFLFLARWRRVRPE